MLALRMMNPSAEIEYVKKKEKGPAELALELCTSPCPHPNAVDLVPCLEGARAGRCTAVCGHMLLAHARLLWVWVHACWGLLGMRRWLSSLTSLRWRAVRAGNGKTYDITIKGKHDPDTVVARVMMIARDPDLVDEQQQA